MLYLVGGLPRVGKSIISQRLASTLGCSWFALDLLRETLELSVPALGHFEWHDSSSMSAHTERFRPYLQQFLGMANAVADDYVVEGLELTPSELRKLRDLYPIRSVVLGSTRPDLDVMRRYGGRWGSWLDDLAHSDLAAFPERLRARSLELKKECEALGITYVDTAAGFEAAIQRAIDALTKP